MGKPVPYAFITGLNPVAQREIERDFLAVTDQISGGPDFFDAIIDPEATVADPILHLYKNLTDLVANEVWAPHRMFNVGVKQRGLVQIIEPTSPLSIITLGDLSLWGLGPVTPLDATHLGWDWAVLTCASTQQVFYYNLVFEPTTGGS